MERADAILGLEAVLEVLNEQVPVPDAAGPNDSLQFFIGRKEENDLIVAVGSSWGFLPEVNSSNQLIH